MVITKEVAEIALGLSLLVNLGLFLRGLIKKLTQKNRLKDISLKEVLNQLPCNIYWKDLQCRYVACNENNAQHSGLTSADDYSGGSDYDTYPKEEADRLRLIDEEVMRTGETKIIEEKVTEVDGTESLYLSHKVPLRNKHNNIVGLLGVSANITNAKQETIKTLQAAIDKAQAANKFKTEFIHNMEHDIRTPFIGIYGMINILAEQEKDLTKKELLNEVAVCAKELLDYYDDILAFSRIESGSMPIISKNFELKRILNSIVVMERSPATAKGLTLELDYDSKLPVVVIGDANRLKRILINLVSNGIKFTDQGFVKVAVRLIRQNEKDRTVIIQLSVKDSGIGIPKDKQDVIYERFSRLHPSNRGRYKGQGLGLRIVKQFITEMNGDVRLISDEGCGAEFIIDLPFTLPLINHTTEQRRVSAVDV